MRATLTLLAFVALGQLLAIVLAAEPATTDPATAEYVNVRSAKPPLRSYILGLELVNRHDEAIWFVIRHSGDVPLPKTDRIVKRPGDHAVFEPTVLSKAEQSKIYEWETQSSFGVEFLSFDRAPGINNSFQAIRLPPHKTLKIADANILASSPISEFEIWEVSEILVNDTVPLQQWIASRVRTPEGHYATLTDRNRNPKIVKEVRMGAPDEAADQIKSITMTSVHRWTLPIAGIEKAPKEP